MNPIGNALNRDNGYKAEYHVLNRLQESNVISNLKNIWYDLEVSKLNIPLEVKSCCLVYKRSDLKRVRWRYGHFDFENRESRDLYVKKNIWLCFVTRYRTEFQIIGFIKARAIKELPKSRYIEIKSLLNRYHEKILSVESFVKAIKKREFRSQHHDA